MLPQWVLRKAVLDASVEVWNLITALITTATFQTVVTVSASSFVSGNFDNLCASLPGPDCTVTLDAPYSMAVKNTWLGPTTPPVVTNSQWGGIGSPTIKGWISTPNAIVLKYGGASVSSIGRAVLSEAPIMLDQLGIELTLSHWFKTGSREDRWSICGYLAPAVASASSLKLIYASS
jgi:hypothetical protein